MQLIKQLDLRKHLNAAAPVFKLHVPYDEADHVLNIALNLLAGGTCLEHLELRRNDEAYLDTLGAEDTRPDHRRRFLPSLLGNAIATDDAGNQPRPPHRLETTKR